MDLPYVKVPTLIASAALGYTVFTIAYDWWDMNNTLYSRYSTKDNSYVTTAVGVVGAITMSKVAYDTFLMKMSHQLCDKCKSVI